MVPESPQNGVNKVWHAPLRLTDVFGVSLLLHCWSRRGGWLSLEPWAMPYHTYAGGDGACDVRVVGRQWGQGAVDLLGPVDGSDGAALCCAVM